MTLKVGDKVVAYNAGTPHAMAVKWDPVEVGDKVNVVTLSDGTKIAMPKLEFDLSSYVWVYPEIPTGFDINGVFTYGLLPLGAAVFTLTDVLSCYAVQDSDREWEDSDQLAGCWMIILSGTNKGAIYLISSSSNSNYYLTTLDFPQVDYTEWSVYESPGYGTITLEIEPSTAYIKCEKISTRGCTAKLTSPVFSITGAGQITVPFRFAMSYYRYLAYNANCGDFAYSGNYPEFSLDRRGISAGSIYTAEECAALGISTGTWINPKYPDYDLLTLDIPAYYNSCIRVINVSGYTYSSTNILELGLTSFLPSECITSGLAAGDKYVIYNPVTKRLVFNDAAKTILSAASWREVNYAGEIVTLDPVQYIWDGQGTVYLSQSKTTESTIFYDNELRVEAFGDTGATRAIDYHENDTYEYSGEMVSRELVNITSILRAGKNYVQLYVKDTGGSMVGFPTPIYIMRTMD